MPYLRLVPAASALVRVRTRIGNGQKTAQVAHVHLVWVRYFKEAFTKELRSSVRNLAVPLHLPKA